MKFKIGYTGLAARVILSAILEIPVNAAIRPSFNLDQCSWNATDIVLVQSTREDGVFSVVASWKGELKPEEPLELPDLKPNETAVPIVSYPKRIGSILKDHTGVNEQIPRQPIGSRTILFLKKRAATNGNGAEVYWDPASYWGGMSVSAVWIDGEKAYCFQQLMNPGPTALSECGPWQVRSSDEDAIRARIKHVVQVQGGLNRTLVSKNADQRAEALGSIALGDVYEARKEAIDALGLSGAIALPEILVVMDAPQEPYDGNALVRMLVKAAGKDSGRLVHARLRQDLIYWESIGPMLTQNWLDQLGTPTLPLFVKFNETVLLIQELERENYIPAVLTVTGLHDFWVSQPQLYSPTWDYDHRGHSYISGLDQVHSEAFGLPDLCEDFVRHVGIKKD